MPISRRRRAHTPHYGQARRRASLRIALSVSRFSIPRHMTSSATLFERAQKTIPGGVNSPVRAFRAVGGTPRFIASADGAYLVDAEGQRYIDYVGRSEEHTPELQSLMRTSYAVF